jgi:hypothetical protein
MSIKRYYLIRTSNNEWDSSYKKICDTLEEAKKEVPNFSDWYCPPGTCSIHEVDENFTTYKVYSFYNNQPAGIKVWKEG